MCNRYTSSLAYRRWIGSFFGGDSIENADRADFVPIICILIARIPPLIAPSLSRLNWIHTTAWCTTPFKWFINSRPTIDGADQSKEKTDSAKRPLFAHTWENRVWTNSAAKGGLRWRLRYEKESKRCRRTWGKQRLGCLVDRTDQPFRRIKSTFENRPKDDRAAYF